MPKRLKSTLKGKNQVNSFQVRKQGKLIGKLGRKPITQQQYSARKLANAVARKQGFGSATVKTAKSFKHTVSATLRKRRAGAQRQALTSAQVVNPGYNPVINNKSHLAPDTFGGPSIKNNLINAERDINLTLHKRVENAIAFDMKKRTPPGANPLQRRGSIEIEDVFDPKSQKPTGRVYNVHLDAGNKQPERYDQYTVINS